MELKAAANLAARTPSFRRAPTLRRFLLLTFLLLAGPATGAQVFDRIEVDARDAEAEIVIRFVPKILYLRHVPLSEGKEVRIFLRLNESGLHESDLMQETLHAAATDRVPGIRAIFPELVNGMLVTFSRRTAFAVKPGSDGRSIVITVPLPPLSVVGATPAVAAPISPVVVKAPGQAPAIPPPPSVPAAPPAKEVAPALPPAATTPSPEAAGLAPPPLSQAEVEARVAGFMDEARRALAAKETATAINRLNRILGLPPSSQTEAAQAMIGEAREQNGEILKARAEYELYLKLFPQGPSAARIRERLAALPKGEAARAAPRPLPKEAGPAEWFFNGSVSAYYYTGKMQIETLVPPPPGQLTFNRDSLSLVDQRSLISTANLFARRRDAFQDTRFVFRDTNNRNYLDSTRSYNRVYAAYVDHNDRKLGYYARLGRQNPNGLGVLERFDGVQGGYNLDPQWRVNAVYGEAVEFLSPFKKHFYGASVDLLPQTGRPGLSAYVVDQTLDGLANRRAVGLEARYFDGRASGFGMLDYDVLYKALNILMLQGNYLDEAGNNYFIVFDHRRAPSLGLTNALLAAPGLTLKEMVAQQGIDAVHAQARALAATSNMFSIGLTHPLSERWQVGADYRLASISATQPVVAVIPLAVIGTCLGTIDVVNNTCIFNTSSQQGTGNNHVVTFQAIGNSLFATNAVGVGNLSLIRAPTYSGRALSFSYTLPFREKWRIDANLRHYNQHDNDGTTQSRISPSLKISYQWRNNLFWEGEFGREVSKTSGPSRNDELKRDYFFTGLRWDFH